MLIKSSNLWIILTFFFGFSATKFYNKWQRFFTAGVFSSWSLMYRLLNFHLHFRETNLNQFHINSEKCYFRKRCLLNASQVYRYLPPINAYLLLSPQGLELFSGVAERGNEFISYVPNEYWFQTTEDNFEAFRTGDWLVRDVLKLSNNWNDLLKSEESNANI